MEAEVPSDEVYIVRNKDTGEVYDIRDLESTPVDSYTMFPQHFNPPIPVQAEVCAIRSASQYLIIKSKKIKKSLKISQ